MLDVVCGDFAALEAAFLERLAQARPGPGRAVAVVAPSRFLADRLQVLCAVGSGLPLLNVRFHTFFSLALELCEEASALPGRLISDPLFHDVLIDRLLDRAPGAPRLSQGTAGAFRSSIRDLIDAGVEPDSFDEHFKDLKLEGADARRLGALFALQRKYLATLGELGVAAPASLPRAAAAAIEEGRSKYLDRWAEVFYYGFYDLTGAQTEFFLAVSKAASGAVFFPYREGPPAFQFSRRFFDLKLAGFKRKALPPTPKASALGPALDCLFAPGKHAPAPAGALSLFNASGARDEAWRVAKEIRALRQGPSPVPFEDIGVVARTLEPYRAVLAEVFAAERIPFWTTAGEPLKRRPIARLALSLLTLAQRDFPARAVLDLIASPYFRAGRLAAGRPEEVLRSHWSRVLERLAVHSGWLQWEGRLGTAAQADLELYPRAVEEGRPGHVVPRQDIAALWGWLVALRKSLSGGVGGDWSAMSELARHILEENFDVPPEDTGRQAWDRLLEIVDGLALLDEAAPGAGFDRFLDALERQAERASLDAPPPNRGVRVLDAMDARGDSFRVLFLIGLQEGVFPRQVREDPLLPDSVRAALRHPAGNWISPKLEGFAEERLLFHLLVASAKERLVCVYQRSDEDGRALVPSVYLRELCRAAGRDFEDPVLDRRVPRQPLERLKSVDAAALTPAEASLLVGVDALEEPARRRVAELDRRGTPGPLDGMVGPLPELAKSLSEKGLSPTALEQYGRCPFQFFASRLLGLDEADEPLARGELSAAVVGALYHDVLFRFHSELAKAGVRPSLSSPWRPVLARAVDAVIGPLGWRELGLYPLLWEAARRRLAARLSEFAAADLARIEASGRTPIAFEKELEGVVQGLRLRGRLDRLDSDGKTFEVVDYKSRASSKKLVDRVKTLKTLQPPLYIELVLAAKAAGKAEPAGAVLHCIESRPADGGGPAVQEYAAADWKALRDPVLSAVAEWSRSMGEGRFPILKDERVGGSCGFCSFETVCRKNHAPTWARADRGTDEG